MARCMRLQYTVTDGREVVHSDIVLHENKTIAFKGKSVEFTEFHGEWEFVNNALFLHFNGAGAHTWHLSVVSLPLVAVSGEDIRLSGRDYKWRKLELVFVKVFSFDPETELSSNSEQTEESLRRFFGLLV